MGYSAVTGNTNTVNIIVPAGTTSLTAGAVPIVTAPGILATNTNFKFSNGVTTESVTVDGLSYPLTLTPTAGMEQLTIGSGSSNLTWTGQTNGTGANNWSLGQRSRK